MNYKNSLKLSSKTASSVFWSRITNYKNSWFGSVRIISCSVVPCSVPHSIPCSESSIFFRRWTFDKSFKFICKIRRYIHGWRTQFYFYILDSYYRSFIRAFVFFGSFCLYIPWLLTPLFTFRSLHAFSRISSIHGRRPSHLPDRLASIDVIAGLPICSLLFRPNFFFFCSFFGPTSSPASSAHGCFSRRPNFFRRFFGPNDYPVPFMKS